jgi:hypothetical protein
MSSCRIVKVIKRIFEIFAWPALRLWPGLSRSGFFFAGEVLNHQTDGLFIGCSEDRLPLPLAADQVCTPQFLDMVGNRRGDYIHGVCYCAHCQAAVTIELVSAAAARPDLLEDGKAVLVGQCLKGINDEVFVDLSLLGSRSWHTYPLARYISITIDLSNA